jgi:integrase
VPASVHHALVTFSGLRAGRSEARESEPVRPVPDDVVEATVAHLSPTVAAMVRLQRLTGARPGEICSMKVGEIDHSMPIWTYTPHRHKTTHHGYNRIIHLGPRAQAVLRPFLNKLDPAAHVFSPRDAEADRRSAAHRRRQTPLNAGNRPGTNRKRRPKRSPGDNYDVAAYRRAIARAASIAFPPPPHLARLKAQEGKGARWETTAERKERLGPERWAELRRWRQQHSWHPHRLRHTAGTEIRRQFGIQAAQQILGHATLSATQIYAEANSDAAKKIAAAIG